jgi:hypothetical protein
VIFKDGTSSGATAAALARKYDFKTKFVYTAGLPGFAADFSDEVLAALRCEAAVKYVQYEGVASTL